GWTERATTFRVAMPTGRARPALPPARPRRGGAGRTPPSAEDGQAIDVEREQAREVVVVAEGEPVAQRPVDVPRQDLERAVRIEVERGRHPDRTMLRRRRAHDPEGNTLPHEHHAAHRPVILTVAIVVPRRAPELRPDDDDDAVGDAPRGRLFPREIDALEQLVQPR